MTDLFDDSDETPAIDPNKDYFSELVGEGKKYKDNAAVGRALAEKDAFIEKLKSETAGLRQDLNARLKLEEVVDRISQPKSPSNEPEQKAPEQDDGKTAINPEDIVKAVRESFTADQKKAQRAKNTEYVEGKLQEAFGPNFKRTIKEQARKLGVGEDFSRNLAADQPEAFLKLFDVKVEPEPSTVLPHSSVNTEGFGFQPNSGVRRKSYYDKLKQADAKAYWSIPVQNQMHKDAQKQGEAFFDRD